MNKKVAVVVDVMMEHGGAEKVTESFLRMFPGADLYTLLIVPAARKKIELEFPGIVIYTSPFQWFVGGNRVTKYISIIKLFSWIYWELLDLKKYDLVISSSHSYMAKNVKTKRGAFHLSYVFTPPRYLYREFCEIGIIRKFPLNIILWPMMTMLRWIDRNGVARSDILVVDSQNVRRRVKRYYGRKSVVVYPPVEVKIPKNRAKKGKYYVCLSRLVKQKGIDLAVKTCTENKLPLVVVGNGDELGNLKKMAGSNVKFVENCEDDQKYKILSGAKALIYTSREEDFGIVPVEALKMGIPVIALASGGVMESVMHKKNGVLFDIFDQKSLLGAMRLLDSLDIKRQDCIESVRKYSFNSFKAGINKLLR
jgi:glycosyltransferase involved in cell wall biosynthesis